MLRCCRRFFQAVGSSTVPSLPAADNSAVPDLALRLEQVELALKQMQSGSPRHVAPPAATAEFVMGDAEFAPKPLSAGIHLAGSEPSTMMDEATFENMYGFLAQQPKQPISFEKLRSIRTVDDLLYLGNFMRRTLPEDLARAAKSLAHTPFGLGQTASLKLLRRHHEESFLEVVKFLDENPTFNRDTAALFCHPLIAIFTRHVRTTELVAQACRDFVARNHLFERVNDETSFYRQYQPMQEALDSLMANRVKVRFKIGQYISCAHRILELCYLKEDDPRYKGRDDLAELKTFGLPEDSFVGHVSDKMNMFTVAKEAIDHAKDIMSKDSSKVVPEVILTAHGDPNFEFVFVPLQSFNIISSLVAHAIKVTKRKRRRLNAKTCDPVRVLVSQTPGTSDVTVRISDSAGGIPLEMVQWSQTYLYSARETEILARCPEDTGGAYMGRFAGPLSSAADVDSVRLPTDDLHQWMQSGVRFPYARVSSRVFGGDIKLISVPGHGTDAYYYCPTNGLPNMEL